MGVCYFFNHSKQKVPIDVVYREDSNSVRNIEVKNENRLYETNNVIHPTLYSLVTASC